MYPERDTHTTVSSFVNDLHTRMPSICGERVTFATRDLDAMSILNPASQSALKPLGQGNVTKAPHIPMAGCSKENDQNCFESTNDVQVLGKENQEQNHSSAVLISTPPISADSSLGGSLSGVPTSQETVVWKDSPCAETSRAGSSHQTITPSCSSMALKRSQSGQKKQIPLAKKQRLDHSDDSIVPDLNQSLQSLVPVCVDFSLGLTPKKSAGTSCTATTTTVQKLPLSSTTAAANNAGEVTEHIIKEV